MHRTEMYKDLAIIAIADKAEAFTAIKPFDFAGLSVASRRYAELFKKARYFRRVTADELMNENRDDCDNALSLKGVERG